MKIQRTRSQDKVLNLLKTLNRAISAQQLYIELHNQQQNMGLATVYRSLDALKLEGTVQVRTLPSGEALYSCIQEDQHHFTCLQCGITIAIDECPVHELEHSLQSGQKFKIYYHTLEFFGLCDRCSSLQVAN